MRHVACAAIILFVLSASPVWAQSTTQQENDSAFPVARICKLIAREALTNGLPPSFFARLIWKESRFDVRAVSPVGAQGIAQFMPETARIEGLKDPFDPEQAIPASAKLLNRLRVQTGNLGLAAAAYNAGEGRVDDWLRRGGTLPIETENYVLDITGETADTFFDRRTQLKERPLDDKVGFMEACIALPVMRTRAPGLARQLTMPWAIQLAGNYRRSVVERAWQRIKSRNASLVEGLPMAISRVRTARGSRGIYALRLGAPSRGEANAICARLRANGGSCIVRKN